MFQRFRPYFRYLQPHRGLLNLAILCGIIAGIASGFGLPYMVNRVFPVIFAEGAERLAGWKLAAVILWIPAVFGIRDGKLVRFREHTDSAQFVEAYHG